MKANTFFSDLEVGVDQVVNLFSVLFVQGVVVFSLLFFHEGVDVGETDLPRDEVHAVYF